MAAGAAGSVPVELAGRAVQGAVLLFGGFAAAQATREAPLMRLGIFRTPNLAAANLAQLLLGAAWIPMWFLNLRLAVGIVQFVGAVARLTPTQLDSPETRPCGRGDRGAAAAL